MTRLGDDRLGRVWLKSTILPNALIPGKGASVDIVSDHDVVLQEVEQPQPHMPGQVGARDAQV